MYNKEYSNFSITPSLNKKTAKDKNDVEFGVKIL